MPLRPSGNTSTSCSSSYSSRCTLAGCAATQPIFGISIEKPGYPLKKCSTVMFSGRGWGCSSRIPLAIIAASGGSAPEWFDTSIAPPAPGRFSMPSTSTRNQ